MLNVRGFLTRLRKETKMKFKQVTEGLFRKSQAQKDAQKSKEERDEISKDLDHPDSKVRKRAILNSKITADHTTKALNDKNVDVRRWAMHSSNRTVTSDHINKALDDEDYFVKYSALEHPHTRTDHYEKATKDENPSISKKAKRYLEYGNDTYLK